MKVRTFFSTLALLSLALLVIGVGGFWGLTARNPLALINQGGQVLPMGTLFVPKTAPVTVSLLVRPDRLTDLWRVLASPGSRQQVQAEIERLEESVLAGTGLSYEQDIRPWLGNEITFAVTETDLDQDSSNGRQPGYLLVLSCRDSERAKAILELFWQKRAIAGASLTFEQFAGSKLIYSQLSSTSTSPPSTLASALVSDKFVLLANSPFVLQQALTSGQARDLNLEQDGGYRKAVAALPERRIGLVVLNLPRSLTGLGITPPEPSSPPLVALGKADGVFDRAVLSLRINRQGLLANTALLAAAGHPFQPFTPEAISPHLEAVRLLPQDVSLAAVGQHLDQLWQIAQSNLSYYSLTLPPLEQVAGKALSTDLSLPGQSPDTLLGWVKDEFALGLTPDLPPSQSWLLVTPQTAASQTAIDQLDELAKQQGLSVGPLTLGDQLTMAWTHLSVEPSQGRTSANPNLTVKTKVAGLHARLDAFNLLSTSPTTLYKALNMTAGLASTARWQQAIAPLKQPNQGYLYLDWPALEPNLRQAFPWLRLVEALGQPLFNHLQSVAVTSYERDEQVQLGDIFLQLSNP